MLTLPGCGGSSSPSSTATPTAVEDAALVTAGALNTQAEIELTRQLSAVYGSIEYLRTLLFIEPLWLPDQGRLDCVSGSYTQTRTETADGLAQMSLFMDQCQLSTGVLLHGAVNYEWSNEFSSDTVVFLDSASSRFDSLSITLPQSPVAVLMQGELATSYSNQLLDGEITRSTQSVTENNAQVGTAFSVIYGSRIWSMAEYALVEKQASDGTLELRFDAELSEVDGEAVYTIATTEDLQILPGDPAPRSGSMVLSSLSDVVKLSVISTDNVSLAFDLGSDGIEDDVIDMSWTQFVNY